MKTLKLMALLVVFTVLHARAQHRDTFQWIGGPTYILHLGSFKILTDPMLSSKGDSAFMIKQHPTTGAMNAYIGRYIAPAPFDTSHIDLLLISHLHADHFDNEAKEMLNKRMHVISPTVNKETLVSWGFTNIKGLSWSDSTVFTKGNETLRIKAVEARHAFSDPLKTALGKGNGYIIEYTNSRKHYRIYWTGDTVWFDELQDDAKYGHINLLITDMGAVGADGTLGRRGLNAVDALKITEALKPDLITPVHHSTFSMYVEPITVMKTTFDRTIYRNRLRILKTSEIIKL
jgi:N-acyl-phosphatidylethanolamine-hydrolysing phospholipase D